MQDPIIMIGAPMVLVGLIAAGAAIVLSIVVGIANRAERRALAAQAEADAPAEQTAEDVAAA